MTELQFQNHTLHLLPEGAAWDATQRVLFVTDLHLGKTAVFREAGLTLPDGADADILQRLSVLAGKLEARTLAVLGDVFHARSPGTERAVAALHDWRQARADLRLVIVPGNHDRRVPWAEWLPGAQILEEGDSLGPWRLAHYPPDHGEALTLCGHLHPGISFGPSRQRKVRLPCFWLRRGALVLPAFGDFTGLRLIEREPGDRVWVSVQDRVAEVPNPRRA